MADVILNNNTQPARTRLASLDAVRGIASFIVLLDHCYWTFPDASRGQLASPIWLRPITFFTNGQAAVIIFFMLSGYVLSFPFFCGTQPSYPGYLFKRFCRIYIPFAVTILIAALLCQVIDVGAGVAGAGDWLNRQMGAAGISSPVLAGHFLMSGTARDMGLDSVMWTLVYEMRVSVIFPLLIVLCRNTGLALGASAIMLVGATRLLIDAGQTQHPVEVDSFWVTIVWTVRVVPYFVVGILLNKHSKDIRELLSVSLSGCASRWC